MSTGTVFIAGSDSAVRVPVGRMLLEALHQIGTETDAACGGTGTCGECRVRFAKDPPKPTLEDEDQLTSAEIYDGWRLACQVPVEGDLTIALLSPPTTSKFRIVTDSLGERFPEIGRGQVSGQVGLAVDLGTTTIASFLIDLSDGATIGVRATTNPQRRFGADVIARIARAHESPTDFGHLRALVTGAIAESVVSMCDEVRIDPDSVRDVVVVGNNTMTHLLWGVDPFPLAVAPYDPVFLEPEPRAARELGFESFAAATVRSLPGIGGHVGSDIVAGLLALDVMPSEEPRLFLDLGTNGEMVLVSGDAAVACSTAAGPAFEGVHIADGMPSVDGAICEVDLVGGDLATVTIGGHAPLGLCGSGLADAIAALLETGVIDATGRMAEPGDPSISEAMRARIVESPHGRSVVIAESIKVTQADVRQVQLAVSAFRTGVEILLDEAGVSPSEVAHTYVGGGFGSSLRPRSLLSLGVLPANIGGIIEPVGNVAGGGARLAAATPRLADEARHIAGRVRHVRIEGHPGFTEAFIRNTRFPTIEP